ncbi:hypothetical protein BS50DRAFT_73829 [Corynespora cassiicola Philippines]|uniref:Transcription factor TFIIIC triple barrel domain-containing protein n=1 Tax=Corynespora cassiicola Philippines TaxID=1448308 RepID=A0A2T2NG78_CORCC|nr:hypothetical protein BS50DRAFT_73829 [Corynespora cassiicola Philippines]
MAAAAATTDEEEWEYEYDENETEDFYITLDLSALNEDDDEKTATNLSATGHPMLAQTRLRALNASRKDAEAAVAPPEDQQATSLGQAQITGLHTLNPLINYNGQLLSCEWNETIGTDMFFAKPDSNSDASNRPLRSLPAVDLLGTSSVKLVAKKASIIPREYASGSLPGKGKMDSSSFSEGSEDIEFEEGYQAPSGFLRKFNKAKAKRGDKTRFAISKRTKKPVLVNPKAPQETTEK